MSKYVPSQKELEAFITRAGFRRGWENLESAARRMAEHACIELHAAHLAAQAEWPSDEDVVKAGRALCKLQADTCNTNYDDEWMLGGEDFKDMARAALQSVRPHAVSVEGHTISVKSCDGEWEGEARWERQEQAYVTQEAVRPPAGVVSDEVAKLLRDLRTTYIGEKHPGGDGCDGEFWDRVEAMLASRHAPTKD